MCENEIAKKNHFDKTEAFEKNCRKLLDELVLLCSVNRIPFYWTAAVKNDDTGTEYISDAVAVESRNIVLKEDKISKHLAVTAGFNVVPNRSNLEDELMNELLENEDLEELEQ